MNVKKERIARDIEALAEFTATPGQGVTRFSLTEEDREAREYIKKKMREAGLEVREDQAGNVIGRRAGSGDQKAELPAVMLGSHFDSVRQGGRFDGTAGVVAALEVARVLEEQEITTDHPLEFVALIEEEGSRFGSGLYGSRAMTGRVAREELEESYDEQGISFAEALEDFGFPPEKVKEARRSPEEIAVFLELHNELGPLLEAEDKEVGIVDKIVGITHLNVSVTGSPDHAGTTPMDMRRDPLAAVGHIFGRIEELALETGEGTVATVGNVDVSPGATNVIPGRVEFTVDIRSKNMEDVENISSELTEIMDGICQQNSLEYEIEEMISVEPTGMSGEIIDIMQDKAENADISCLTMDSGAGHDAMMMADIAKTGMIFVPSRDGQGHSPEEWTDMEDLAAGTELLFLTVTEIA
ncbi:Zn-dependent hydrolase [Halarsenatibacter silvermanii]|uniref:Allantoate deiminase n=1 Tax=Halarsenatibacter silvermanii TaxID=321763 RepID=A0A1G9LXD4_9FIRM|nr:Zn-dependent hydrolase [Halarsenatibacter silvermanii]SDL66075.1 allantoate deiminase [Halarsenatibacter silvermanii]